MNEAEGQKPHQDQLDLERADSEKPAPPAPVTPNQPAPDHQQHLIPAPSKEADYTGEQTSERTVNPDKNAEKARDLTTPPVGRIIASIENPEALKGNRFDDQEAETTAEDASRRSPKELPSKKIAVASYEARDARWSGDERPLEIKAAEWRKKLGKWITKRTDPGQDGSEALLATIASLDIDKDDLDQSLETFRETYVGGKESNVELFAQKLADGCRVDGKIDLEELSKRLDAAKDLFKIFGTDNNVHETIQDYATAHALLSEAKDHEPVRAVVKEQVKEHLQQELTDPTTRSRLELLYPTEQEDEPVDETKATEKATSSEEASSSESEEAETDSKQQESLTDEQINAMVQRAKDHALTEEENTELINEHNAIVDKLENMQKKAEQGEEINEAELVSAGSALEKNLAKQHQGRLAVPTTEDFKKSLLMAGIPEDLVTEQVQEREAAFADLLTKNQRPVYVIEFKKSKDAAGEIKLGYNTSVMPTQQGEDSAS